MYLSTLRSHLDVFLGKLEKPLGRLIFVKDGHREFSQFAYSDDWLADAQFFDVMHLKPTSHKPGSKAVRGQGW